MQGDPMDGHRLEAFLGELRATYGALPVEADDRLAALFTDVAAPEVALHPSLERARRRSMLCDFVRNLPGKVAAGLVGATLAWSTLGAAGAVPAPVTLTSGEWDDLTDCVVDGGTVDDGTVDDTTVEDTTECAVDDDGTTEDDATTDADGSTEDDGGTSIDDDGTTDEDATTDDDGGEATSAPADDGELPPVPTHTSEAAHIHDFDDDCGNHGAYVSYFAQHGEEPPCATAARAGTPVEPPAEATADATAAEDEAAKKDKAAKVKADKASKGKGNGRGNGRR